MNQNNDDSSSIENPLPLFLYDESRGRIRQIIPHRSEEDFTYQRRERQPIQRENYILDNESMFKHPINFLIYIISGIWKEKKIEVFLSFLFLIEIDTLLVYCMTYENMFSIFIKSFSLKLINSCK